MSSSSKTALVTGGTSGIGLAASRAFLQAGYDVIATGVSENEVEAVRNSPTSIEARCLDVRSESEIDALVDSLPRLDVLVNSAGMILRGQAEQEPKGFAQVVDVNLTGTLRVSAACRPLLRDRRGSVVNVASMLSFFGSGAAPAYSASKGGIAQLTKSLAIAWAPDHIRVNAVAPGWIETPLTQPLREDLAKSSPLLERTPLRRWGKPEDVAGAILFLVSPQAEFITGVILPVDGGYSIA